MSDIFLKLQSITDKNIVIQKDESVPRKYNYWTVLLGITMGLLSGATLAISDVFALLCVKIGYSPSQVLLVKSLMMMAITTPLLVYKKINILKLKRKDTILNIVKSISENGADLAFYYAMDGIGMGDASSIAAGTLPIFSPVFASIFIQEKFRNRDCIGIAINIAGIILISRPEFIFGSNTYSSFLGYVYALLAGIWLSVGTVCSRAMSDDLSLIVVVFYNGLCGTIITLILVYPTSSDRIYTLIYEYPITITYLVAMVALFVAYLYSVNRSLQLQSVSKTTILRNISIFVSFVADIIVYHKQVVILEIIGAVLVILSSIIAFVFTCFETKEGVSEETKLFPKPK
ncbi:solute carrier family 35 member G1-like [Saccoglossus kowalevskii]|uniref:Solute carrier family 35 member G1-like n=1 Tax=Saccoglossus kowalevskii TaxID=10224 RepID=A0ABM0MX02_SACKO|nr:PREDICTED: solute carrier family 35 member G1-like [Saccoglossus kowalevskii]